jgi:hypothetical protein
MAAPYEIGYFFDNEQRRIDEVSAYCPGITCIKIPDGGHYRELPIRNRNLPPELVNNDPYGEGWLVKIEAHHHEDADTLLSEEEYQNQVSQDH